MIAWAMEHPWTTFIMILAAIEAPRAVLVAWAQRGRR